jgi:chromosomal replication initiation ATPase DnaA
MTQINYWVIPGIKDSNSKEIKQVIEMICEDLGITFSELKSKNREQHLADRRHVAFYILNVYCNIDLALIGKYFNRTHASVIHGRNKTMHLKLIRHFGINQHRYSTITLTNYNINKQNYLNN